MCVWGGGGGGGGGGGINYSISYSTCSSHTTTSTTKLVYIASLRQLSTHSMGVQGSPQKKLSGWGGGGLRQAPTAWVSSDEIVSMGEGGGEHGGGGLLRRNCQDGGGGGGLKQAFTAWGPGVSSEEIVRMGGGGGGGEELETRLCTHSMGLSWGSPQKKLPA